jgi:hypothetical protein
VASDFGVPAILSDQHLVRRHSQRDRPMTTPIRTTRWQRHRDSTRLATGTLHVHCTEPLRRVGPSTKRILRIAFLNDDNVRNRIAASAEVFVPVIALGELYYGAQHSAHVENNMKQIHELGRDQVARHAFRA